MKRLEGKVAVVTGGASGIGEASTRLFLEEGAAAVVVGDLQREIGLELAEELGPRVTFVHCDVSRESDVAGLVERAANDHGRLDIMFNNAGFGGAFGPIDSISEADFDLSIDVLLKSVFFGMKHAAKVMRKQVSGSIISTSSGAGLRTGSMPHLYATSKAAVIHLTKSVANELAEDNIRVNCVCPGFIVTPLGARRPLSKGRERVEQHMQREREERAAVVPLGRAGEAVDVARSVLFLASDESEWITGEALVVDGGVMTGPPWRDRSAWLTQPSPITIYRPEGR
ncbi:MAG: SDR family oxidoreductase [Microbacterium sp.]|jgi:NAD(P)-dependent dehydrogenase (short-subunit alcohol dehydrogenase family)